VRRAVEEKVAQFPPENRDNIAGLFINRSSFHLLKPMTEAYFYAERTVLQRAGVNDRVTVHRVGSDVEEFETDDPDFLPQAQRCNEEHRFLYGCPWWREEKHPERYLEFLCWQSSGRHYRKMGGGVKALHDLDWAATASLPEVVPFARALFEDIADFLGVPSPLGHGLVSPLTYPSRDQRGDSLVMRNI